MLGPSSRPSLPASSSDFALPPSSSSSSSNNNTLAYAADDLSPFMLRIRRPSLLVPRASLSLTDGPLRSPLATSMTSRRSSTTVSGEESESDRENVKMWTDSPPSGDSGSATPLLLGPAIANADRDQDTAMKTSRPRSPSTPPSSSSAPGTSTLNAQPELSSAPRAHVRRLSHSVKAPRILSLISESRPEEDEVKSEAQFQRLVASCSELPFQPRTPRAASDRGRYPEEASVDEFHREDTPSDDGDLDDSVPFSSVEPISIMKPVTPAHSVNGDDPGMLDSPGGMAMDIDMPSSIMGSPSVSWRCTPPPTSSTVRNNKRKLDDRYDPYPTSSKRRAVSPSLSYLRESQPSLFVPRTPVGTPRLSMPSPMPIPIGGPSSATSSPIVASSSSYFTRSSASVLSSPTLRAQTGLASPVLRPILPRPKRNGETEREVDGAGAAVNGLSLG